MDIISYYMIINHLNCLLKAVTSLRVSSGRQWQAAAYFDVSPYNPESNVLPLSYGRDFEVTQNTVIANATFNSSRNKA